MAIVPATNTFQAFTFESADVRVINIDGDPWFVASDILAAMKSTTTLFTAKNIVEEDLGDEYVSNTPIVDSLNRNQNVVIFHEAAVTLLISRSRTPMGKAFNRHLHSVILPTIRKTGKFVAHPEFDDDLLASKKRELKQARAELLEMQIRATRARTLRLKARVEKPMEFNPTIAQWADVALKYESGAKIYIGNGKKDGTLITAYHAYCQANNLKPVLFQRFSPELLKYLIHSKQWDVRKLNREQIGTPIANISFI